MAQSTAVSVVVPTRNRGVTLLETLQAIMATDPAPFELIVVDQSAGLLRQAARSAVEQAARAADWTFTIEPEGAPPDQPGQLRLIESANKGAGRARNAGARAARQSIVLFGDDDIVPESGWVGAVAATFEQHPQAWAVYGRILPYQTGSADGLGVVRDTPAEQVWDRPVTPWYLGSGANMAFRTEFLLDRAGGMDEILSIGDKFRAFEDIDIGYRALLMGGSVVYSPQPLVYHNSRKDFAEQLRTEAGYGLSVGAAATKFWRCGDRTALKWLLLWVWQMGIRRAAAGLLKWRSWRVIRLAMLQFWWPLIGVWRAWRQPLDRQHRVFLAK